MSLDRCRKWYHVQWYSDSDSAEDRKLILRLDLLIVPYAILSYWIKYVDQANLNNAYVAGMKEDLGFYGNELVQLQTLYTVGAVVGQVPFMFLFTYVPMHYLIPALDILWGVFTLLQYRTTSFAELAAYRFLVGWFEAAFFPAMHYMFGSWYRGDEIARRGGIFYVGLTLGTLTAGLIQAGASASLHGVKGLAGWRWMYIICSLITIPVGILGYFIIPGTPDQPNRRVLRQRDIDQTEIRLNKAGHTCHEKFRFHKLRAIFMSWRFWGIITVDVLFWNAGLHPTLGVFLLWLKDLGVYSASRINELGSMAPGVGILYTLLYCFASDLLLGPAWVITIATIWNIIGLIILIVWDVPNAALWFAFSTIYSGWAISSVIHGWINHLLRASPAERSFTLVLINLFCQSTTAWTPLLVFPTVEGPRYTKGYSFAIGCAVLLLGATHVLRVYLDRNEDDSSDGSAGEQEATINEVGKTGSVQETTVIQDQRQAVGQV